VRDRDFSRSAAPWTGRSLPRSTLRAFHLRCCRLGQARRRLRGWLLRAPHFAGSARPRIASSPRRIASHWRSWSPTLIPDAFATEAASSSRAAAKWRRYHFARVDRHICGGSRRRRARRPVAGQDREWLVRSPIFSHGGAAEHTWDGSRLQRMRRAKRIGAAPQCQLPNAFTRSIHRWMTLRRSIRGVSMKWGVCR
jgi:hypothetical protein